MFWYKHWYTVFLMERVINNIRSANLLQYLHSFLRDESNISFHFDKTVEVATVKFLIATHILWLIIGKVYSPKNNDTQNRFLWHHWPKWIKIALTSTSFEIYFGLSFKCLISNPFWKVTWFKRLGKRTTMVQYASVCVNPVRLGSLSKVKQPLMNFYRPPFWQGML